LPCHYPLFAISVELVDFEFPAFICTIFEKKQAIFLQNRRIFRIFADVLSTKIVSTKKTKN